MRAHRVWKGTLMTSRGMWGFRAGLIAVVAIMGVGATVAACAPAQRPPLVTFTWGSALPPFQAARVGRQYSGRCPVAPTDPTQIGGVSGTDRYTGDSAICTAAVHDGVITLKGGVVTYLVGGPFDSFVGSTQNGVTTSDSGPSTSSFTFVTK
jgi:hypothetical protein